MYNVNVAGVNKSVSSFDAARKAIRALANTMANSLMASADFNTLRPLYRSSKTAMNEVTRRRTQAQKILDSDAKIPAKAGEYNGSIGSAKWSITKQ
jgi:GTP1/Obg family GTP-binding protein